MKSLAFIVVVTLLGQIAHAKQRSGNVSFGGIQVKVILDIEKRLFQIGESKFNITTVQYDEGIISAVGEPKRVGIGTSEETLQAIIYPVGGNGGNLSELNCENSRIKITRQSDEGKVTVVKNECAYLE